MEVCFEVTSLPDSDGDGLFDVWETCGFDPDGSGPMSKIDLPGFRADPMHKDLFLEIDWVAGQEPTRASIQALKNAFAVAPIDAGTSTSNLTQAKEDGFDPAPDTCRDGVDNGGDGVTDVKDPDCPTGVSAKPNPDGTPGINLWVDTGGLTDASGNPVGDNLGGGSAITLASDICAPDDADEFNAAKAAGNFDPARGPIFRYAISHGLCTNEDGAGPNTCSDGIDNGMDGFTDAGDPECRNPSWGEIGGNDVLLRGAGNNPNLRV